MVAGPASYGMTDTLGRMHSDAQLAGSSSVPARVEMMDLGNNSMVGMTERRVFHFLTRLLILYIMTSFERRGI